MAFLMSVFGFAAPGMWAPVLFNNTVVKDSFLFLPQILVDQYFLEYNSIMRTMKLKTSKIYKLQILDLFIFIFNREIINCYKMSQHLTVLCSTQKCLVLLWILPFPDRVALGNTFTHLEHEFPCPWNGHNNSCPLRMVKIMGQEGRELGL